MLMNGGQLTGCPQSRTGKSVIFHPVYIDGIFFLGLLLGSSQSFIGFIQRTSTSALAGWNYLRCLFGFDEIMKMRERD